MNLVDSSCRVRDGQDVTEEIFEHILDPFYRQSRDAQESKLAQDRSPATPHRRSVDHSWGATRKRLSVSVCLVCRACITWILDQRYKLITFTLIGVTLEKKKTEHAQSLLVMGEGFEASIKRGLRLALVTSSLGPSPR